MAALIARIRGGHFSAQDRVLFWHTGGQPGFFA
jgi:1-aminocyclopropane-1-carboxylate deaminase/D-cysteine desulfhydrase-like pyridoxal-dependent ACC family enzyme